MAINSKPKHSIFLKSTKNKVSPVILKFNFGYKIINQISGKTSYKPLLYNTGLSLSASDWLADALEPKNVKDKARVQEIVDTAYDTFNYLSRQGTHITPELLKNELDIILGRKERKADIVSLTDFIEQYILTDEQLATDTRKAYKVLNGKIREFENEYGLELDTSTLTREVYIQFQDYMKFTHTKSNSVWGKMKNLKSTLNRVRKEFKHIEVFDPSKELSNDEKIKLTYEKKVYFEYDKIQEIIDFVPESKRLKNVRLILLNLVFSGCRYSDVVNVKPNKRYDSESVSFNYAHFLTHKGEGQEVVIPILKPLQDAIDQHGEPPYPISEQKFNKYVKELCKEIGFDEETQLSYTSAKGGKKFETKLFYQFVSSHIGRRTFITHLIDAVPITLLSKVTGHSLSMDKDVIYKYDKKTLLQSTVLFMKELKRVCEERKDDFPIQLA